MPYHSSPISPELLARAGTITRFGTVVHNNHPICAEAAESLQDEFNKAMSTDIVTRTVADVPGIGRLHAIALTIPNCLPERLDALTRFAEFTLLNDDFYDYAKKGEIDAVNDNIQSILTLGEGSASSNKSNVDAQTRQFQSGVILNMMNLDSALAMDILNTYSKGLHLATFAPETLTTLEEYLPIRVINSGLDVFQTMSCFGMGIKLSPEEKEQLQPFVDTAMQSTTLVNDFYSWPKEIKTHLETPGSERPFNAVAILMQHGGYSEKAAMEKLRTRQVEIQEDHLALLRARQSQGSIPERHMLYILAAQYAASGSEFWSFHVPRYPSKEDLNQPEVEFVNGSFRIKTTDETAEHLSLDVLAADPEDVDLSSYESDESLIISTSNPSLRSPASSNHIGSSVDGTDSSSVDVHEAEKRVESTFATHQTAGDASSSRQPRTEIDSIKLSLAPYEYVASLPSKGVRDVFIDSLDYWLEVPEESLQIIKKIVSLLHQSSLMLDDIEDGSLLRRGNPATHVLYGLGQTINSANYVFVQTFEEVCKLRSPESRTIFLEELKHLHEGQALDLNWSFQFHIPTVEEYMWMIDNKTGGLFRLCVRLMQAEATKDISHIDSTLFVKLMSQFFQIRDDYQNLMSDQYTKEKGFAEDLDEGKISLPLIYFLNSPGRASGEVLGLFKHKQGAPLSLETKQYIIKHMKESGALGATHSLLQDLQHGLLAELGRLADKTGSKNATLELILRKLWVE